MTPREEKTTGNWYHEWGNDANRRISRAARFVSREKANRTRTDKLTITFSIVTAYLRCRFHSANEFQLNRHYRADYNRQEPRRKLIFQVPGTKWIRYLAGRPLNVAILHFYRIYPRAWTFSELANGTTRGISRGKFNEKFQITFAAIG